MVESISLYRTTRNITAIIVVVYDWMSWFAVTVQLYIFSHSFSFSLEIFELIYEINSNGFQVMVTRTLHTIPTQPCNFVISRISMPYEIVMKNCATCATVKLRQMFNGIIWLKILDGFHIFVPFYLHLGPLHIGYKCGKFQFCFTVVTGGIELHKCHACPSYFLIHIIGLGMVLLY